MMTNMHLLLLLFGMCSGQGPWNGMSKTTYAAETDPLGGMAFVQKYFGSTPDSDSCDANVCRCDAGNPADGLTLSPTLMSILSCR